MQIFRTYTNKSNNIFLYEYPTKELHVSNSDAIFAVKRQKPQGSLKAEKFEDDYS